MLPVWPRCRPGCSLGTPLFLPGCPHASASGAAVRELRAVQRMGRPCPREGCGSLSPSQGSASVSHRAPRESLAPPDSRAILVPR